MAVIPCAPTTPVYGIVTFDPAAFASVYPEFAGFVTPSDTSPQLAQCFALAQLILNNTCCSRVRDANQRDMLLQLLTAHICLITYGSNDGAGNLTPPLGLVGRISNATEGTVTVAAEFGGDGGPTQDWYLQSRYGALYWTATAAFRTAVYIPAPQCGPNGPGFNWPGYGGYGPNGFGGSGCGC